MITATEAAIDLGVACGIGLAVGALAYALLVVTGIGSDTDASDRSSDSVSHDQSVERRARSGEGRR